MLRRLLPALLVLVPAVAALESLLVRARLPWRSPGVDLFTQSLALWAVFGLVALLPAALTLRLARRRAPTSDEPQGGAPVAVLCGWMVLPVAAHATLDRYVGLSSQLSALRAPGPWLRVSLVLALGLLLLVGLARLCRGRRRRWLGLGTTAAALVVGLLPPVGRGSVANGANGAGEAAAGAGRPNLLLLVWDTCRADKLQPYGHDRPTTPHLARFAEESIVFDNATSAATFTFSSHLSMLAGVYPSTHGARLLSTRYDPRRAETVAPVLRRAGYRTGAFVGTDVLAGRTGLRYGFERYDDQVDPPVCDTYAWRLVHDLQALAARAVPALRGDGNPHWFQDFQRPASEVLERALAWIREDDPRPWFCFVNLYDVHWPYLPQADGLALVAEYTGPLDGYLFRSDDWRPGTPIGPRDEQHVMQLYEGELLELDQVVDRFLDALELTRGDTAVVMTSDHGEAFGEAGQWKHEDVGEAQVRIPLIVRPAEAAPRGRRVATHVTNVDVGPTLLGLAGLAPPEGVEGLDLLRQLDRFEPRDGEVAEPRVVFVEDRDHLDPTDVRVALYRGRWKLVRRGLGAEASFELFDLEADPAGLQDVAEVRPAVLAELTELLAEHRRARDQADAEAGELDRAAADGLQALGYTGE